MEKEKIKNNVKVLIYENLGGFMTIYNKSEFARGIVSLLIAVTGIIALFFKGFSIKLLFSTSILLLFALYEIRESFIDPASLDLEAIEERKKEKVIAMKSKSKTFQIMWWINAAVAIILAIALGVTKNENLILAFIITSIYISIQFILEIFTYIHYKKENDEKVL